MKNSEGIGAKRTQHNTFLWVALWVVSHFNYEICERFAPIFLRRTHVNLPFRLQRISKLNLTLQKDQAARFCPPGFLTEETGGQVLITLS
ncbi:hypothetical protein MAL06_04885 [Leptospira noguchii]|nr:hypothetical protein [Leptospira noguchii]UOG32341.1 hypothetical protein MAL06_04885 [Leptospira noguchii]